MTKGSKSLSPLVSIIIRTKNEERWIDHCLSAIESQNMSNYEIILVDDFSDKKLQDTLDLKNYENVVISRNTFRQGQSESILNGINLSNFDTIGLLDGDGQNPPAELKKLYDAYFKMKAMDRFHMSTDINKSKKFLRKFGIK